MSRSLLGSMMDPGRCGICTVLCMVSSNQGTLGTKPFCVLWKVQAISVVWLILLCLSDTLLLVHV